MKTNHIFNPFKERALACCFCLTVFAAFGSAWAQTKPDPQATQRASQEQTQKQALLRLNAMAQEAEKLGLHDTREVKEAISLARQNVLAQALQEKWLTELKITPAMLEQEYKRQVTALGTVRYRLRHIVVAEESTAKQLWTQLQNNKNRWGELAEEHSLDTQTRQHGGLTGWIPMGELQPVLLNAVRSLKKGQLADGPIQTPAGWHLVMLEDMSPYEPPSMEKTTSQLQIAVARQYIEGRLKGLKSLEGDTTKR